MPAPIPWTKQRLKSLVRVRPVSGCWEWSRCRDEIGYGLARFRRLVVRTHRISFILFHGDIPPGFLVLHRCDNPPCANPNHLFLGDYMDNAMDRDRKGRAIILRGDKIGTSILSGDDVREIRRLRARGNISFKKLGERYRVTAQCVFLAAKRKNWKHVE